MHERIKESVDKALNFIQTTLEEKFPEDYQDRYKAILQELAKVRHDESDAKGHKYFVDEIYYSVKAVANFPDEDEDWYDSLGIIGFILSETSYIYREIECDEEAEAEGLYHHLVELIGDADSRHTALSTTVGSHSEHV